MQSGEKHYLSDKLVETAHRWMGWCPNAPAMRTAPAVLSTQVATVHPVEQDGGSGVSGRIDCGIKLAAGSIKILNRNKRLLWFSILTGLVILFMFIAGLSLHVYGTYPYPVIGYPLWLALVFSIQMISVFCIYSLLAGLIRSVSSGLSGRPVTLREGLSSARSHMRSLLGWSVAVALLGTALYVIQVRYFGYLSFTLTQIIDQFPFNFIVLPEIYSTGPIGGGFHILSAITFTTFAGIINVFFFILTLFVVPVLVLENKHLSGAVAESIPLVKKSWGEIVVCFLIFCLILLAISLTSLIFRLAYGVVSPGNLLFWYPGDGWIASAALYILVWCILVIIGSTVVGISLVGLYTYAKTGQLPDKFVEN
jgi:hypothetical protein